MQQEWKIHTLRFVILVALQVLILQSVHPGEGWLRYGEIFLYPLFLMSLPFRLHAAFLVMCGFATGIIVDLFYDTPGVHAGASVLSAFVRPLWLQIIEPRAGYDPRQSLTRRSFGMGWFLRFSGGYLFIHILAIQSLTLFSFYYMTDILWRTALCWALSFFVLFLQDIVIHPRR